MPISIPAGTELEPEVEAQVIVAQRDTLKRLATLEQEYLYQQLLADSLRQDSTALLKLARQDWHYAQVAATAWTRAAEQVLQWTGTAKTMPPEDDQWLLEDLDFPLQAQAQSSEIQDFELQDYWDTHELSRNELSAVFEVFELFETGKKLTWRQQAQKFALYLQEEYQWYGGEEIVTNALDRPRWGKLARSLEEQIKQGATPDELAFALELRAMYREQIELHIVPQKNRAGQSHSANSLRWPTAMLIAKRFIDHDASDVFNRLLMLCRELQNPYDYSCWADRLDALLEGYPEGVDTDYWLSAMERG